MDADTPEIVEAAKAIFAIEYPPVDGVAWDDLSPEAEQQHYIDLATAARPFILEEAAKVVREFMFEHCSCLGDNDKEDLIRSLSGEGLDDK